MPESPGMGVALVCNIEKAVEELHVKLIPKKQL